MHSLKAVPVFPFVQDPLSLVLLPTDVSVDVELPTPGSGGGAHNVVHKVRCLVHILLFPGLGNVNWFGGILQERKFVFYLVS